MMKLTEQEKNRIRELHNNFTIKEQPEIDSTGMVMLDPSLAIDPQIKQIVDNITGNILEDLAILIDDMGSTHTDGEMMGTHEIGERLVLIMDKINKNEYLKL